jgi:hypothetical protein
MKFLTLILPLLVQAAPSQNVEKRQEYNFLGNFLGGKVSQTPKIGSIFKTLSPEIDSKAKRELKMWGPFKLTPSNGTHPGIGFSNGIKLDPNSDAIGSMISPPCSDCTILKAIANLAFADGKIAGVTDGVYSHHIIVLQNGRRQLPNPVAPPSGCLNNLVSSGLSGLSALAKGTNGHVYSKRQDLPEWMESFIPKSTVLAGGGGQGGSGSALAVPETVSKVRSGAYVGMLDTFQFSSETINYDPTPKDIYLILDFEWVPGKVDELHEVGMGSVGLDCNLASLAFKPPKDKAITYTGANWTLTHDGYFVNFTPHLHDSGLNVKVFLNEKEVCESHAIYGEGGSDGAVSLLGTSKKWTTITGYTPCAYMTQFKRGDQIRITAE